MTAKKQNFILPPDIRVGDVIRYKSAETIYLVTDIHQELGFTSIILVFIKEKDGIKRYSRDAHVCVINEKNTKGHPSRDWSREVVLLERGHVLPSPNEIEAILR